MLQARVIFVLGEIRSDTFHPARFTKEHNSIQYFDKVYNITSSVLY